MSESTGTMTGGDVARMLGVTRQRVLQLHLRGRLPRHPPARNNRHRVYRLEDVERLQDRRAAGEFKVGRPAAISPAVAPAGQQVSA